MKKVFESAGGGEVGASLAVIVAHAAPFMGAQTTMMQRYFLPHPLDTIISQPFGMSEDLLGMAMAEATLSPITGSVSITVLIVGFNLLQFFVFSSRMDKQACWVSVVNLFVGVVAGVACAWFIAKVAVVAVQLLIQLFLVPYLCSLGKGREKEPGGLLQK